MKERTKRPSSLVAGLPGALPTSRGSGLPTSRRTLLTAIGAGWASTLLGSRGLASRGFAQSDGQCGAPTLANIEGPFYLPGAPETAALSHEGRLLVGGRVRDSHCRPARNAVIEVWQANEEGEYDLRGFHNRGVVRCNAEGMYSFRTVTPGNYLNGASYRPRHIHVKVHADGRPTLTTQLYFSGDPHNEADPWFRESLVLRDAPHGCSAPNPLAPRQTYFDFVV